MLSIITASYNYENYIRETIESILNQTSHDWELIIVDDGSKDNSVSVIKEYCDKDSRIKLFTHENNINKGLCETIKFGLSKCSGDYIAFLESDDKWIPCAVENKLKAIKQYPESSIIINDIELIGEEEYVKEYLEIQKSYFQKQKELFLNDNFDIKEFFQNNYFPTFSCITVKKEYLEKADFNSPSKPNLDWYLWVQILNMCRKIIYIPSKDTLWRVHSGSYISSRNKNDYQKFFGELHKLLYKNNIPNNLYVLSDFLHKRKLEKFFRSQVRKFDEFLKEKFPQKVDIEVFDKNYEVTDFGPILSICIPTYQRGEILYNMITKFLETKNDKFEIVVSDNCSNDGSVELLKKIKDNRFRLIENSINQGSYTNGLNALSAGKGKYIMPLMDKDFISNEKIDDVIHLLSEEKFYVGYFRLDYDDEQSYAQRFYTKTDCIKNFAYGTRHPSGFLYNRYIFHKENIFQKYINADEITKTFMVDFIAADLCKYQKAAIFNVKFARMAHPPFKGMKHSHTYSPEKNNLFFTPENRFKAFQSFINHLNSQILLPNERIIITVEMLKQLYHQSTKGYLDVLENESICEWYNIPQVFKEKECSRNLNDFILNLIFNFHNFKDEYEEKRIIKKFKKYILKNKYKTIFSRKKNKKKLKNT